MELTVFRKTFGNSPSIRVIDFFLDNSVFDYSMADVIRQEGIAYNTVRPIWANLVSSGIIMHTSKTGKAARYKLNRKNAVVKHLWALSKALVDAKST